MVNKMLEHTVGASGKYFANVLDNWNHGQFKTRCFYSHIPGEDPNITDSGLLFSRKLKTDLNIPQAAILDFEDIFDMLFDAPHPIPVLFVDDFIGSGNQVMKAWNANRKNGYSFHTLIEERKHICVYAPYIVI